MALKDVSDYATFPTYKESEYFSLKLSIPYDIVSETGIIRIKPTGSKTGKE